MLMHSTLEEAWGKHPSRAKSKDVKDTRECDLFENRKSRVNKPFAKNRTGSKQKMKNMMLMGDDEYENGMLKEDLESERYHGYTDARAYSATKSKTRSKPPRSRIVVNPKQNRYYEDPDSDIEEVLEEVNEEVPEEEESSVITEEKEYIYEEVYDEDEDNYLTESLRRDERAVAKTSSRVKDAIVEEELEDVGYLPLSKRNVSKRNVKSDMTLLLDLSIYTISGILLIVIMEQFVQLGVKLKSVK